MNNPEQQDWYYVGHYGQLGPLTFEQLQELIRDGVVERDTYVWAGGMPSWVHAQALPILAPFFAETQQSPPPFTPGVPQQPTIPSAPQPFSPPAPTSGFMTHQFGSAPVVNYNSYMLAEPVSDKSRVVAGILNIILPGVGRMYLGHVAHGVIQLILTPCVGVGAIWALIDGILMLTGAVKYDGYGRRLKD